VTGLVQLTPLDPRYPTRLRGSADAPASLTVRGGSLDANHVVAVVGSREATPEALSFAHSLSSALARAGAVVVSGGAVGIDAAAHRGALSSNGRTWAVAPTGCDHCFPEIHVDLFETIGRGPGAMLWPFAPDHQSPSAFLKRNRVLVALADAVVVVQARRQRSGALHAARCARKLDKPLWVVPAAPWMVEEFAGSLELLRLGARPLVGLEPLMASLSLEHPLGCESATGDEGAARSTGTAADEGTEELPALPLSEVDSAILRALSHAPLHADAVSSLTGLTAQATITALLTLALENVVVEGPPGFFRRQGSHNGSK
jgi:DNA processing protein